MCRYAIRTMNARTRDDQDTPTPPALTTCNLMSIAKIRRGRIQMQVRKAVGQTGFTNSMLEPPELLIPFEDDEGPSKRSFFQQFCGDFNGPHEWLPGA